MSEDDAARAIVARLTVDLVAAYCRTLPIAPQDLAGLISYVGAVVGRSGPEPSSAAAPVVPVPEEDRAGLPRAGFRYPNQRDPISDEPGGPAPVICLSDYRARLGIRVAPTTLRRP